MADEDLRQRLEKLDTDLKQFQDEIKVQFRYIESRLSSAERIEAVAEVQRAEMKGRFERMEAGLAKINNNISWMVKLIIGGLMAALVSFAMGGGLVLNP